MGGFTINGCGATDRFNPIKELGTFTCPRCQKVTGFTLDEVKRKIDVFFIPTATVSVKYAIMCKNCENGKYIDEAEKNALMSGAAKAEIDEDGIAVIMPQRNRAEKPEFSQEKRSVPHLDSSKNQRSEQGKKRCPECDTLLSKDSVFCSQCGYRFGRESASDSLEPAQEGTKTCPKCGTVLKEDSVFCSQCGHPFSTQSATDSETVALEPAQDTAHESTKTCPKCGTVLKEDSVFCLECGYRVERNDKIKRPSHSSSFSLNADISLPQKKVCPKCRIFYVKTKQTCTLCGSELVDE